MWVQGRVLEPAAWALSWLHLLFVWFGKFVLQFIAV